MSEGKGWWENYQNDLEEVEQSYTLTLKRKDHRMLAQLIAYIQNGGCTVDLGNVLDKHYKCVWWTTEDVEHAAERELTLDEKIKVLEEAVYNHDAQYGINWDTLHAWSEEVYAERNK